MFPLSTFLKSCFQTTIFPMNVSNIIWAEKNSLIVDWTDKLVDKNNGDGFSEPINVDKNNGDGFEILTIKNCHQHQAHH